MPTTFTISFYNHISIFKNYPFSHHGHIWLLTLTFSVFTSLFLNISQSLFSWPSHSSLMCFIFMLVFIFAFNQHSYSTHLLLIPSLLVLSSVLFIRSHSHSIQSMLLLIIPNTCFHKIQWADVLMHSHFYSFNICFSQQYCN